MKLGLFFRHLVFWTIPIVATVLVVITGFLYWIAATPTGTRWLINTAVVQLEGQSHGVKGSLWHGVELEYLHLKLPDELTVELEGAALYVDWPQLWQQRALSVQRLAADKVSVWMDGESTPSEPSPEPFAMPSLPIRVQLKELYVGSVFFAQQGQLLPIDLSQLQLQAQAELNEHAAQLQLHQARVVYEAIQIDLEAKADLSPVAAPWQSQIALQAKASSAHADSQICLGQYLPDHWQVQSSVQGSEPEVADADTNLHTELDCGVDLTVQWAGSLEQAQVTAMASGQGLSLEASTELRLDQAIPIRDTFIDLKLPDNSGVQAELNWQRNLEQPAIDSFDGTLKAQNFDVGAWIPGVKLHSILSFESQYNVELTDDASQLQAAQIHLTVGPNSVWNHQAVAGHIDAAVKRLNLTDIPELWQAYYVENSNVDLTIGQNQLQLQGAFGLAERTLKLLVSVPEIKQLWPGLEEIGPARLEAELKGSLHEHQLTAQASYDLGGDSHDTLGQGEVEVALGIQGQWDMNPATPNWRAILQPLQIEHAGLTLSIADPFNLRLQLPSPQQAWSAEVTAFELATLLNNQPLLEILHERTVVDAQGVDTRGQTKAVTISAARVVDVMTLLGLEQQEQRKGGIVDLNAAPVAAQDLQLLLDWNVSLRNALSGEVRLQRVAGDILIPTETPFMLGLTQAELLLRFRPEGGSGRSMVRADLDISTQERGQIHAEGFTPVYYTADQGLQVRDADSKELSLQADMDDIAWMSLFLQEQLELGGALQANLRLQSTPDGGFSSSGNIQGQHLKIVRLDDGVRLLDGTLQATLENNRFVLDRLYFPAILRVEPKEWRTATWVNENPDAKGGGLTITGYWELEQNIGDFRVNLYRYPILQRADRYAMVSGDIHLMAALPHITVEGKITADAGWFDLDMLGGIPTLDSDVVVIRSTDVKHQQEEEPSDPLDITMNLEVNLGPRFYLTGYGVNSGLVGSLQIQMLNDRLTALGALNTRGGAIEIYGQRLQLRRGTITFQGDIDNPVLDIQALRTGLSVEAGVRVAGTARRPRIDLISVPEVSEIEKLSWLIFGHGPDEGGDMLFLLSVGASLLGGGEPFYRQFGIDELSLRSGELGGAGSILPATSVASSPENVVSEAERQFIEASKTLSNGIKLSIRQALADTGTVGRTSYRLARGLTAELSIGTVSGLALVYRWFSRD